MPFDRPTLITLIERAEADMDSRLAGSPYLRRRLMAIIARMEGGVAHGLYGFLDWLALQIMPDTAEEEHLERWSSIWGLWRKAAARSQGYVVLPAEDGKVVPTRTLVQRRDGCIYVVQADTVARDGVVSLPVSAAETGTAGNCPAGTPLQLIYPLEGVEAQGVSMAGLSGGTEAEQDASLRARLLERIRNQPSGGTARDYEMWAKEVPGVTRAWCSPGEMGRGSVTLRFVMDGTYENGIPMPDDTARVKAHIETRRPATADVYVVAPVPHPVDLDLRVIPDTPRVRVTTAEAAWAALRREAVPGGVVIVSHLTEAISLAQGEEDHVLLSPSANVHMPKGHLAVPGAIHWGEESRRYVFSADGTQLFDTLLPEEDV